jgi:DNA polymerase-1
MSPAAGTPGRGPLLVVDTPSMLYRAFFALPKTITGVDDRPVNALLGTANLVLREVEEHSPRAVVLCFGAEAARYRKELLPSYHGDRDEMPELLVWQWEQAAPFFSAFGWTIERHPTLEADDLLGTLARKEEEAGGEALILTGDRDMFQCATDKVSVLYVSTKIKGGAELMGPAEVEARYGIPPELVPDFIALRGDPSDGIPGAKGVGEKGASELLREYGSLESLLESALRITRPRLRTTLVDSREELLAFKDIATLRDSGSELPADTSLDTGGAAKAAREHGMLKLAERLEGMGG